MKKNTLIIFAMTLFSVYLHAQQPAVIIGAPTSIDENLSLPDESAMLDVKSVTKGILIPRMSSSDRDNIVDPAIGLLVYDYDEQSFWYFNGVDWQQVGNGTTTTADSTTSIIFDEDIDTWVSTEKLPDEDQIRMVVDSFEQMRLDGKTLHLEAPGNSIFIGKDAGINDDGTSNSNLFFGPYTGYSNSSGHNNIFLGNVAGFLNTSGSRNIFIGSISGVNNTTGRDNMFLGYSAGLLNSTGEYNMFTGNYAGRQNSSGSYNIFNGYQAGYFNNTGSYNLFIGRRAGWKNTSGENNIALGFNSGYNTTTGDRLIMIGRDAGHQNTTGYQNVFVGTFSGYSNSTGYYNTFLGDNSGKENTTGYYNTFVGLATGFSNETGHNNTFVGGSAGFSTISGSENVAIGRYSFFSNSTGDANTALGTFAGQGNSTGSRNTLVGKSSGEDNTTGSNNTYLGFEAGKNNVIGNGNVFIGHQAGINNGESHQLFIDNQGNDIPLIHGDFSPTDLSQRKIGVNRIALTNTFEVDGTASKSSPGEWISNSDVRLKKNIQQLNSKQALQSLLTLKGISYEWNDQQTGYKRPEGTQYGFAAQNIQEVYPELVRADKKGFLETAYGTYDPMFVEALRALNDQVEMLRESNQQLKEQVAALAKKVNAQNRP